MTARLLSSPYHSAALRSADRELMLVAPFNRLVALKGS
jgi:hypothetical protein